MIKYVAGFLFNENFDNVLLIQKLRPTWMNGMFNAIGGKIEPGETSLDAMIREFNEEVGLTLDWHYFWTDADDSFSVDFYWSSYNDINNLKSKIDEQIYTFEVKKLPDKLAPNVDWLIKGIVNEHI